MEGNHKLKKDLLNSGRAEDVASRPNAMMVAARRLRILVDCYKDIHGVEFICVPSGKYASHNYPRTQEVVRNNVPHHVSVTLDANFDTQGINP